MIFNTRRWLRSLTLCALLGACASAWAWGDQGHRITGLVAESLLTADARAGLRALMGHTDLATMSVFMDRQKDELEQRIPGSRAWHYDNLPVCEPRTPRTAYCPGGHCASVQITRHYRRLVDPRAPLDERRLAVQVLVHLVGDIHQPLHASDHGDRGGNEVRVSFTLPSGQQRQTNLHAAWDTDFVRSAFATRDERQIASNLVAQAGKVAIRAMQKGTVAQWMAESHAMARDSAYGRVPGFACSSEGATDELENARQPLDDRYVAHATGVVPRQLLRAGARIAKLLNRSFSRQRR
jgi:hypothetical protein